MKRIVHLLLLSLMSSIATAQDQPPDAWVNMARKDCAASTSDADAQAQCERETLARWTAREAASERRQQVESKMIATPRCDTQRKCEAMWAAAQDAIGTVTMMRNRIVTDSRIETFVATGRIGLATGVVTKVPVGADGYEIRVTLQCPMRDCEDMMSSGTKLFNTLVNGAAESVR